MSPICMQNVGYIWAWSFTSWIRACFLTTIVVSDESTSRFHSFNPLLFVLVCVFCVCTRLRAFILHENHFPTYPTQENLPSRIQLDSQSSNNSSSGKSWIGKLFGGKVRQVCGGSLGCGSWISFSQGNLPAWLLGFWTADCSASCPTMHNFPLCRFPAAHTPLFLFKCKAVLVLIPLRMTLQN